MGIFFSKKKDKPVETKPANPKTQITERDRAVLELKRQRDRMRKYTGGLENIIKRESEIARELLSKNEKKRAVMVLKKKKYQETMIEKVQKQLLNVDQMLLDIDDAVMNQKVFEALKIGNAALQAINAEMNIDDVELLMEESAESMRVQDEISTALSTNLTGVELGDLDEEVTKWMAELEAEDEKEKQQQKTTQQTKTKAKVVDEDALVDMVNAVAVPTHKHVEEEDEEQVVEVKKQDKKEKQLVVE